MNADIALLEKIASADVDAAQAEKIIAPIIVSADERIAKKVYRALRAWTWKALNERRRDEDLRAWYQLIRGVSAFFLREHKSQSDSLQVLYELIHESIAVSEIIPVQEVVNRDHVRRILNIMFRSPGRWVQRSDLIVELKVKQANLSRIMGLVINTGLVERRLIGKNVEYRLTAEGFNQAFQLTFRGGGVKSAAVVHFMKPAVIGKEHLTKKETAPPVAARYIKNELKAESLPVIPIHLRHTEQPSSKPESPTEMMSLHPNPQIKPTSICTYH